MVTQNKKHVIPKNNYGRKRREFFHNEEREQRVQSERKAREQRAEKAEKLAKNNEERVKENLRKARIEKLTQEEIQQQQALVARNNRADKQNATTDNQSLSNEKQVEDNDQTINKQQSPNTNININNESETHLESNSNVKVSNQQHSRNVETTKDTDSKQSPVTNEHASKNEDEDKSNEVKLQESDNTTHHTQQESDDKEPGRTNPNENQSNIDKVKYFFKDHWPNVLIVVAVILLLTLMNAIFTNVDQNGKTKDNIFQSNNDKDKEYTTTMKSANNATQSVVTVENDTSKEGSSAEKETQEAGKENELGSGVVYKKVGDSIFIMTNAHVVGDKKEQKITYGNGDESIGKVIGTDKFSDIAVVKAKIKSTSEVKPIKLGDSSTLILGEPIIVVGNPLGVDFKGSVSEGIISGLNRHVPVD